MQAREYQARAVDNTIRYLINGPKSPVIVLPTGSGKSLVAALLCLRLHTDFSSFRPRGIITVPSKELCQQNYDKLKSILPPSITVGIYCEGLKRKEPYADIVVASIKSIAKYPDSLGPRMYWINDECHLAKTDGSGDYWKFYDKMVLMNERHKIYHCKIGMTATPFRGNGVWITEGKKPMYNGISHETKISELLPLGFLSPLVVPGISIKTRIDTSQIRMSGDDYNLHDLAEKTKEYLYGSAVEAIELAADRKKWMAFLPTVETANDFSKIMNSLGVPSAVVTGDTPGAERDFLIDSFKKGYLKCLITVIALTTGFDVPDIDCIIWLRSTVSPVLYVQGAGRGTRPAPGKINCLWLDFTSTTERLGAIDMIRGKGSKSKTKGHAPCIVCKVCGEQWMPASTEVCAEYKKDSKGDLEKDVNGNIIRIYGCGNIMRTPEDIAARPVSEHEIMIANNPNPMFPITSITMKSKKNKFNKNYISVEFNSGMSIVCYLQITFSGLGLSPDSRKWWRELTGDHDLYYNNFPACEEFLMQQLATSKKLGVTHIIVDRSHSIKFPRLQEILR